MRVNIVRRKKVSCSHLFTKIKTSEYLQRSCLCFLKVSGAFHVRKPIKYESPMHGYSCSYVNTLQMQEVRNGFNLSIDLSSFPFTPPFAHLVPVNLLTDMFGWPLIKHVPAASQFHQGLLVNALLIELFSADAGLAYSIWSANQCCAIFSHCLLKFQSVSLGQFISLYLSLLLVIVHLLIYSRRQIPHCKKKIKNLISNHPWPDTFNWEAKFV